MNPRKVIEKALQTASGEPEVFLSFPERSDHGDYTTNIALTLAKQRDLSPRNLAEEILKRLNEDAGLKHIVDKVEIAGPGFINFFLTSKTAIESMLLIHKEMDRYGYSMNLQGQKVIIEYTDPNPFKEFHVGHLYSNIVGESLARLFDTQSAEVKRACYQGDVGMHVAKSLYGMLERQSEIETLENQDLDTKAHFLGECYVLGSKVYEENPEQAEVIKELNRKVYAKDVEIYSLYQKGRTWSLEYFDQLYVRLGTTFDFHYFESEVSVDAVNIIEKYLGNIFVESEGAVIFPGEKYGLHTRVFLNKQRLPTYEAKDLALPAKKKKDFDYDQSYIVTGNEVTTYFGVVLKALSLIDPELSKKTKHIGHGMVKFSDRKISSRTGDIITVESLLSEAKKSALTLFENMDNELVEAVGLASIKYALLKSSVGGDIEFSFDKSISLSGNSGPYLQYTHARTQSILDKAESDTTSYQLEEFTESSLNEEEKHLMRLLSRFPEVLSTAQKNYSASSLCTYLYELAQYFNTFYTLHKVIGSSQERLRLALTGAVGQVLKNGLYILGIQAPSHM